jgi:hypothetical protein
MVTEVCRRMISGTRRLFVSVGLAAMVLTTGSLGLRGAAAAGGGGSVINAYIGPILDLTIDYDADAVLSFRVTNDGGVDAGPFVIDIIGSSGAILDEFAVDGLAVGASGIFGFTQSAVEPQSDGSGLPLGWTPCDPIAAIVVDPAGAAGGPIVSGMNGHPGIYIPCPIDYTQD